MLFLPALATTAVTLAIYSKTQMNIGPWAAAGLIGVYSAYIVGMTWTLIGEQA